MRIFIMGTGNMGRWFAQKLCAEYEVAVYDIVKEKMNSLSGVERLERVEDVKEFDPHIVINAVSLSNILEAFDKLLPYVGNECIISDIASVKGMLPEYYKKSRRRFASTHPMFGPTFTDPDNLYDENVIIIRESDEEGKVFFKRFYGRLGLHIHEYSFEEHDETIAYSLSIPFASSMVFAACMKKQDAPGTTFKRHLDIAERLLSEDDHLLAEIMFNPYTIKQIERIEAQLSYLKHIIKDKDYEEMFKFLNRLRSNIGHDMCSNCSK